MSQCKGTTAKGDRCKKTVKLGEYCHLHVSKKKEQCSVEDDSNENSTDDSSNEKCSICIELIDEGVNSVVCAECKGCFHEECVASMVNFRCPLCRKFLETELNEEIIERIRENKKKKLQEDNEEARRITNRYRRAFANETSIFTPNDIGTIMSRVIVSLRGMNVE